MHEKAVNYPRPQMQEFHSSIHILLHDKPIDSSINLRHCLFFSTSSTMAKQDP